MPMVWIKCRIFIHFIKHNTYLQKISYYEHTHNLILGECHNVVIGKIPVCVCWGEACVGDLGGEPTLWSFIACLSISTLLSNSCSNSLAHPFFVLVASLKYIQWLQLSPVKWINKKLHWKVHNFHLFSYASNQIYSYSQEILQSSNKCTAFTYYRF